MASPPNHTALSPPYPSPLTIPNPRKRPSLAPPNPPSTVKRRKPSTASVTSAHPLRQTSFPPENALSPLGRGGTAIYSRSPSVESSVVGSVVTGKAGRGRGKKGAEGSVVGSARGKGGRESVAGTAAGSVVNGSTGGRGDGGASVVNDEGAAEDDDEGDEGGGAVDTVLEGGKVDEAAAKQEKQRIDMLMSALNEEQSERYDTWRRVKLKKEIVRRITNQTLSQSVPQSVVTTIGGFTKVFIGELIERARQVQVEWLAGAEKLPTGEPNPLWDGQSTELSQDVKKDGTPVNGVTISMTTTEGSSTQNGTASSQEPFASSGTTVPLSSPTIRDDDADFKETQQLRSPPSRRRIVIEERDRGPLTPDHLREALRRYKRDREGGAAGFMGLSLQGKENTAPRMGGRRLFR